MSQLCDRMLQVLGIHCQDGTHFVSTLWNVVLHSYDAMLFVICLYLHFNAFFMVAFCISRSILITSHNSSGKLNSLLAEQRAFGRLDQSDEQHIVL